MADEKLPGSDPAEDEAMRLWGAFNAGWDEIEIHLATAFIAMIDDERVEMLRSIFFSVKGHSPRRDMVEVAAKYALKDRPDLMDPLKNAIAKVKARADARNSLTHGRWSFDTDPETGVLSYIRAPLASKSHQPHSLDDLGHRTAEMYETAGALLAAVLPLVREKYLRQNKNMSPDFIEGSLKAFEEFRSTVSEGYAQTASRYRSRPKSGRS